MVVASCRNKYDGTNLISAVPTSLLIAPGLRTIQFLFNLILAFDLATKSTYQSFFELTLLTSRTSEYLQRFLLTYRIPKLAST
jgi:hypothetical protein